MNTYVLDVVQKYRRKGIVVDTNAALLYVVGSVDISLIGRNKRTSTFSINDFDTLSAFLDFFTKLYTTPHILTEISNLLNPQTHDGLYSYITNSEEHFVPAHSLANGMLFKELGITDSSIYEAASNRFLVLSDDGPLIGSLRASGLDVLSLEDVLAI